MKQKVNRKIDSAAAIGIKIGRRLRRKILVIGAAAIACVALVIMGTAAFVMGFRNGIRRNPVRWGN